MPRLFPKADRRLRQSIGISTYVFIDLHIACYLMVKSYGMLPMAQHVIKKAHRYESGTAGRQIHFNQHIVLGSASDVALPLHQ
jgi:hypothetical protein